jgi:sporulation protein YlmC with PRC-barrel domain
MKRQRQSLLSQNILKLKVHEVVLLPRGISRRRLMYMKFIAMTALAAALSTAAFAQSEQNASAKGQWQSSKLIHMNVYNGQNEKIGDIKELMLDKSGKIDTVAIGVGGFLGMGEHTVGVKFDQLKWVDAPVASTSSANDRPATTGQKTSDTKATATKSDRNYPDHAVLDATKDQLKAMPQFSYNK